jgi:hypothetical protein
MKHLLNLPIVLCLTLLLTACGESSTDEPLPEGATPTQPKRVDTTTPSDDPADTPPTEPDRSAEDAPDLPPLPTPPATEDDAERLSAPGISYVMPEGWSKGPDRSMRLLTLVPPDAGDSDLAISKWPGDVGGFPMNVNRWARQVGLPPIPGLMTAAASDFEKFEIDGVTATWIPLMNEETNTAIIAVWVPIGEEPENPDQTWTFKLTCQADQVQKLAPAMRALCESIKFGD